MELKFIGQGLDPESDITAGNFIIDSLESENYNSFNAFVAFVSTGGLKNIIDQMLSFREAGGKIKLYLGVNLNATSKEALVIISAKVSHHYGKVSHLQKLGGFVCKYNTFI